jgi:SAM-dependent methyltransferase
VSTDADPAEKKFRALQVVKITGLDYKNMRVLDFGCGEGHIAKEIASHADKVVGYDARDVFWGAKFLHQDSDENLIFTDNIDHVKAQGPYDRILLYDVLDHLEGVNPHDVLRVLAGLIAPKGQLFCRCHPWTSKHGSHFYESVNKAYIHLALTPDELTQAGCQAPPGSQYNLRVVKPIASYNNWFEGAGWPEPYELAKKISQDQVPEFFAGSILDRIIKVTWNGQLEKEVALRIMANQFIDYTLSL